MSIGRCAAPTPIAGALGCLLIVEMGCRRDEGCTVLVTLLAKGFGAANFVSNFVTLFWLGCLECRGRAVEEVELAVVFLPDISRAAICCVTTPMEVIAIALKLKEREGALNRANGAETRKTVMSRARWFEFNA